MVLLIFIFGMERNNFYFYCVGKTDSSAMFSENVEVRGLLIRMVRTYKKTPGTRNYKNYSNETLEEALEKITNDELTINAASLQYHIPFGTLYNKYKGLHGKSAGGQTIFSHEEEISILRAAASCSDWGFPLTLLDIRFFAKSYLDKRGRTVERFQNNLPGVEWAASLLKRHKNSYAQRVTTNIKRSRAAVGQETLNRYFDHLEPEVKDIPPSHIFNYDETNMADDPGKKKCLYRRGVKYPEKVMNYSKSSTTVMFCGSADGTLLPPYVIYRSTHLYDTWKERGIVGSPCCNGSCCSQGTRYNRTASGWIDAPTFRDWFITCFLPHATKLDGRKILIGDNLASHLDQDVITACDTHNIGFVCLVPNSTHLCQPLDVGFFRPLKGAWRKTLETWKKTHLRATSIPKESFPSLLRQAIIDMDKVPPKNGSAVTEKSAVKRNLISSFKATGIHPFDRERVLRKIPDSAPSPEIDTVVRDSLTEFLREQRYGQQSEPTRKKRRVNVEPGKSISTAEPSTSLANQNHENVNEPGESHASNQTCESRARSESPPPEAITTDDSESEVEPLRPKIGKFILGKFASKKGKKTYHYVCSIEDISGEKIVVQGYKSQMKSKTDFREVPNDMSIIEESDIITYLPTPKFDGKIYKFPTEVMIKEL
ncbi:uncharacterized protein LOC124640048 [Helicoverpa zea]|uniref:uncharacterized protein LOC124631388 n=1 Tax=Helicoverpa zea TaxID=7113 RepID=UPI001F571BA4|nr:uncharacterized protein LOC124631388 [Helicoverpa zea]XP_047033598.1 uncharacterized protein LOC124640048 [Helicoverpa zea]XP_049704056.1 uncharacterized protein LOC126056154 isoform X1 [Helicoverpa armigera]XP_049704059.1 uncharacterized protein LOC126056155 [Helicoverpa armigera]